MQTLDNTHALIVGIAAYQHINPLPATVRQDAEDIYKLIQDPLISGYQQAVLLLDDQATRQAILNELNRMATVCNVDSTFFLYISSHGGQIKSGPHRGEYLLPVDTLGTSEETLAATSLSSPELTSALQAIPARKVIVVFDCCHAAGIGQIKDAGLLSLKAGLSEQYYVSLAGGRGRVIFAASREDEPAWALGGDHNSLFTKHLLAGLKGGAPGPGGVIRVFDLYHYIQPRVTAEQPRQHPIFKAEVEENFAIARYPAEKSTPLPPTAPPDDDFPYDVFISYRHEEPGKTWVRKTLIPHLQAAGLRVCVDYLCFDLGRPVAEEMEKAVLASRYTLAILTPAYLKSNFTEFENRMAEYLGLEKSQHRLLAVIREDCTPRLSIRMNMMLNMTDDSEFTTDCARLIYQLRISPDEEDS